MGGAAMNPTARKVWIVCGALAFAHVILWVFTGLSFITAIGPDSYTEFGRAVVTVALHVTAIVGGAIAFCETPPK